MKRAERISSLKPYFFAELSKRLADMRNRGVDVIRLDMGSPDLPPPPEVIETLVEQSRLPNTHGYTMGAGTQGFRQAVSDYYLRRFDVNLDPKGEVIELIGSKEGLFILSQVLLNPGDLALVPDPAYAVYAKGTEIAGASVYKMPLKAKNAFLPDFSAIPSEIAKKAKILWMNYPNNPTGAIADIEFFQEAVNFAKDNDILLAHDAPYVDVGFNGYQAPSLMNVPGAKDVAIEFNSLSKAYNMAGWRIGMVVGNPDAISYMETYKTQQDTAIFAPILSAGIQALSTGADWIDERNHIYQERRDVVMDGLHAAGFRVEMPQAALYVWVPIPEGKRNSMQFCSDLLEDTGVSTTPGSVFGEHGEGYLRISLVIDQERIREGVSRMAEWVKDKY